MEKKLLIMLPSPLIMARTYKELAKKLEKYFEVLVIDLPGSGTNWKGGRWNPEDYARWAGEEFQRRKYFVFGHSNSGPTAVHLAKLYPDLVQGLIIADTIGAGKVNLLLMMLRRSIDAFLELSFSIKAFPHVLWNLLCHPANLFHQIHLAASVDIHTEASKAAVPTLLCWGKLDHTMPLQSGRRLKDLMRSSTLYVSETGSHDWCLTNTDEFSEAVGSWIHVIQTSSQETLQSTASSQYKFHQNLHLE